ncbi:MAG TPA: class I SAM-dependent methyltransferase, partial [Nocardioides sp.]|nr:class I SAM-dependent methyltransferase [Nocardioides sp.]
MSLRVWDERVVPRLTDLSLRGHEVGELRDEACAGLAGRVLEIGFGSGLNVRWYPPEVTSVTAIEPSDLGWELSARRRGRTTTPIERAGLDGQQLDLPDDSHDSALVTFSLCTVPDPVLALREARRVVRAG